MWVIISFVLNTISKPNKVTSLIKENTVGDANIDRSKPRTGEILIPNIIDNQNPSKISELDKKML